VVWLTKSQKTGSSTFLNTTRKYFLLDLGTTGLYKSSIGINWDLTTEVNSAAQLPQISPNESYEVRMKRAHLSGRVWCQTAVGATQHPLEVGAILLVTTEGDTLYTTNRVADQDPELLALALSSTHPFVYRVKPFGPPRFISFTPAGYNVFEYKMDWELPQDIIRHVTNAEDDTAKVLHYFVCFYAIWPETTNQAAPHVEGRFATTLEVKRLSASKLSRVMG